MTEATVTVDTIAQWYKLKQELATIKLQEGILRERIFNHYFPTPMEGTNTAPLNDGTGAVIKGTYKINRTVVPEDLEGLLHALRDPDSNIPPLSMADLIIWKPSLVIKEYRTLTEEEKEAFDQCLTIKPGTPDLAVEIPKKAQK